MDTSSRALLMIPGPIEVDPAIVPYYSDPPSSHVSPGFIASFGRALGLMRTVWCAGDDAQPFILAGSGTLAMEVAAANLVGRGDKALVVNTGYFSDRMALILERYGVEVTHVHAPAVGELPPLADVAVALRNGDHKALFATHVDTSTGVRVPALELSALARHHGVLSVFDGVCATAAEVFRMERWGADVYLTGSQKAIGLPAGLALLMVSPQALEARASLTHAPPLYLDYHQWLPIMRAYEEGRPSYFATPATTLVPALEASLASISSGGMDACFDAHKTAADQLRAAIAGMGLSLVPTDIKHAANTLSAVRYPKGADPARFLAAIKAAGVIVAGGLHPEIKAEYFRIGHMGYAVHQPEMLERTIAAVRAAVG